MTIAEDRLKLADWRRRVSEMYACIREAPEAGRQIAWNEWRSTRNDLFKYHPQSPLSAEQRDRFHHLEYFPYNAKWRFTATLEPDPDGMQLRYQLGENGDLAMKRLGWVKFAAAGNAAELAVYWIESYGGGLFLPFRDSTARVPASGEAESYGGGRYLYDTIKGADQGTSGERLVLDFNYAYNPSCAYHARWVCPLAPPENHLTFAVRAGEKRFGPVPALV